MPNTYLKRRWTLARVAEEFRERVPVPVHLFLALAAFYGLTAGRGGAPGLLGPLLGAATLALGSSVLGRLGVAPRAAAGWALVAGTGTVLWPATRAASPGELATAFLLMALLLAAQRCREAATGPRVAAALAVFVVAAAQRPYVALTAPLWAWFVLSGVQLDRRRQLGLSVAAALGGLLLFVGLVSASAGGAALERSLADLSPWSVPVRVWAALFAPGRSLLLYSPPLLLALVGLPALGRRDGAAAGLVAALGLLALGLLSVFGGGPGRVAWLDEPMTAALPVLMLPAAFASLDRRGRLALLLAAAGVAVQVAAVAVDYRALAEGLVYRRLAADGSRESFAGVDAGPLDPAFDPDVCPLRLSGEALYAWVAGQPTVEFAVLHGAPTTVVLPAGTLKLNWWFMAPGLGAWRLAGLAAGLGLLFAAGGALRARLAPPGTPRG